MNRTVVILLSCFVLFSIFYSVKRYHYFPVDGDLPAIVMAHKSYQKVMQDPFGLQVLLHDSVYPATNRYFAHLALSSYFLHVPLWLQPLVSPVSSIYYACALAKTIIQFFILWILATAVSGRIKPWHPATLGLIALLLPLFQVSGFNSTLGVIDTSITYAFFYAGAFSLVLLFFLPFFYQWHHGTNRKVPILLLLLLAVVLVFNGPLNAAVLAILCPLFLVAVLAAQLPPAIEGTISKRIAIAIRRMPARTRVAFVFTSILAAYSLYLGRFNSENLWEPLPLTERYARLPQGVWQMLTGSLAWPLLLIMVLIQTVFMFRFRADAQARRILVALRWVGLFAVIYLLVLPLGGYRSYRPLIVRMDTLLPVTLAVFFYYGLSAHYLLDKLGVRQTRYYLLILLLFSSVFLYADLDTRKNNTCERKALETLAASPEKMVRLPQDCPVLSWVKTTDYQDTEVKGELLYRWGVTRDRKLFYQD